MAGCINLKPVYLVDNMDVIKMKILRLTFFLELCTIFVIYVTPRFTRNLVRSVEGLYEYAQYKRDDAQCWMCQYITSYHGYIADNCDKYDGIYHCLDCSCTLVTWRLERLYDYRVVLMSYGVIPFMIMTFLVTSS